MNDAFHTDDLIQAPATPRGRSAVAIIRTSGEGCIEALSQVFSRPQVLMSSEGHRVHLGWLQSKEGERIDEVLVTVFRGPASYTGEDSVEISCHGGPTVVDRVLALFRSVGFRDAGPGEFTFRAFRNGKMDLTKAEAVREIIDSRTDRARALAISRLAGSVSKVVDQAKAVVVHQSAVASLALDYPDDEAEHVSFNLQALQETRNSLETLAKTWKTGRLYKEGLTVVLAGPANAGKSSLFNLFLKEERSIVTERPGTTRDWLEAWLNLDGMPLRLVDTAGLREGSEDPIEQEGIRRTRDVMKSADFVIAVADGCAGASEAKRLEQEELAQLDDASRLIRVWNKADTAVTAPQGWIPVSALTGDGFTQLEQAIRLQALDGGLPPEGDAAVIDSARQKSLLDRAVAAIDRFLEAEAQQIPADLLAEDLRDALDALGELTGAVSRTDVLNKLFGEFCVGK